MKRALGLLLFVAMATGCQSQPSPTLSPGTVIFRMTDAQRELYLGGCPGPSPVCGQAPEMSNGLECWSLDEVRWCRPAIAPS